VEPVVVSHETHARADPDRHSAESDKSFRSPAGSRERAGGQGHSVENDRDPKSPYAPKKARTRPAVEPDFAISQDLARLASFRALEGLCGNPERQALDVHKLGLFSQGPDDDLRAGGVMFDNWALRSLEPERLGPPPAMRSRRDNLLRALIILIVSVLAAPIAYYVLVDSKPALRPQIAAFDSRFIMPSSTSSGQEGSQTINAPDDVLRARAEGEMHSERPNSSPTRSETVAMLQSDPPSAQAAPSSKAVRVLDPEEIALLMKKGEQLLAAGDLVAARIAFQRAAEAGDGSAAVALGATYDPTELRKRGVVGMGADVSQARSWYQKAEKFGSAEARGRLDALAGR
jgi:TPR repeat protein